MWVNDLKKIHFIWSCNHPSEICPVEIVRDIDDGIHMECLLQSYL